MKRVAKTVSQAIGETSLVDLSELIEGRATLLGKFEAQNPGGSVKDRAARAMLDAAEASGKLKKGDTIIEPTSGNTGVALAMLTAARGYHMIVVMPETMSIERQRLAAFYGAQVILTPGLKGMKGAIAKAHELAESTPNSYICEQFENPANPQAHYETTGPEIWRATEGKIDAFIAGVGTGGTITGCGRFLKEQNPDIQVIAVEPAESPVLSGGVAGPHKIQGIGAGFIPKNYDQRVVDRIVAVPSQTALNTQKALAEITGYLVGISSGAAVSAAQVFAHEKRNTDTLIVTILPDTGERYLSLTE